MASILIVDDEPKIRRVLKLFLTDHGHTIVEAESGEMALERSSAARFDLAILDLTLPGINGLETLKRLRERDPSITCIVMTAYGSIRSAVDAVQAGAWDYLTKPFDNDVLLLTINRALEVRRLNAEVHELRSELESSYGFTDMVGASPAMREVFRVITRVAATDGTVLITGESGTGKELVARAVHRRSTRAKGPFVAVNSGGIPSTLIESEFFGSRRGAFTDARDAPGKFEEAHRGTLFLDEIGELPLDAQAKLLRVLQERTVTRLGSSQAIPVDVRIVAATNRNLKEEIAGRRFREDLYYRLAGVEIELPPLRRRKEDLPPLIEFLLERLSHELRMPAKPMSAEARRLLIAYDWPGNIRELENALRSATILSEGGAITAEDLPAVVRGLADAAEAVHAATLADAVGRAVERVERALILATLAETGGSRAKTAERLDINRKTLFVKMKQYGLAGPGETE